MTFPRIRSTARVGLSLAVIAATLAGACGGDDSTQRQNTGGSASVAGEAGQANVGEGGEATMIGAAGTSNGGTLPEGGGTSDGGDGGTTASSDGGGGTSDGGASNGGASNGGASNGGTLPVGGGGSGGAGGTLVGSTRLGRSCVTNTECADANAPNLTCVTSKDAVLGNGAPPRGLCTQPCTLPTAASPDDPCEKLGTNAICYPFSSVLGAPGYCIEGCTFGTPDIGEYKCHDRAEFACNPALLDATNTACVTTDDCQSGEICVRGACNVVFPGCLPSCRGDIDCDAGTYCDQSFLSGVCVTKQQTGKTLGEPCKPNAANTPDEPDECLGFCRADDDTGQTGHCAANCALGQACAYDAGTQTFDGACLSTSNLTGDDAAVGDFGFCTPTCNCTADCQDATLGCEELQQGRLPEQYSGEGLCFPPEAASIPLEECSGPA